MLINANSINKILIQPNKYIIQIIDKEINGGGFLLAGFGYGNITSYSVNYDIEVCRTEHATDYKIVSEWIHKV